MKGEALAASDWLRTTVRARAGRRGHPGARTLTRREVSARRLVPRRQPRLHADRPSQAPPPAA